MLKIKMFARYAQLQKRSRQQFTLGNLLGILSCDNEKGKVPRKVQ